MTTIVNYVWMRRDEDQPHTIPTSSFYFLQQNAQRYPDASFNLWIESYAACEDYAVPPNVTPLRLDSLPAFSKTPILSSPKAGDIWAKVDIARLLVLQHTLNDPNVAVSIYSDFDVEDVSLNDRELQTRLDNYGVAFSGTYHTTRDGRKVVANSFENGYMVFTKSTSDLLQSLIVATSKVTAWGHRNVIYNALNATINTWSRKRNGSRERYFPRNWQYRVASLLLLHPCGWKADSNLVAEPRLPIPQQTVYQAKVLAED